MQPLHWQRYATGMPELEVGESIGWNQGESQVYRARWNGRDVVLKRHRELHKHARERHGYVVWAHTGLLPELLHIDAERLELLLERIPASCALGQPQTRAMYRAAGEALRQLHDAAPRGLIFDDGRGDVQSLMSRYLPRAQGVLPPEQVKWVEATTRQLLNDPFPPTVLRHADYTARNWLWDGERLTVIDIEMARPDPAVLDVAKLWNTLSTTDNAAPLQAAFQQGYGREWTPLETRFLSAVRAFDALTMVVWCFRHDDPVGHQHFRDALNRLCPL